MTVGPGRVFAGRCASGVEERGLREQDERTVVTHAAPGGPLRMRDLLERAADVDRRRPPTFRLRPRDRPVERPVQLESARTVAVVAQRALVAVGQSPPCDAGE